MDVKFVLVLGQVISFHGVLIAEFGIFISQTFHPRTMRPRRQAQRSESHVGI